MSDEGLRTAERAWLRAPGDPSLAAALATARRRAGLPVPPGLERVLPGAAPRLLWERRGLGPCHGWTEQPVLAGQELLLATLVERRDRDPAPLLRVLSMSDGAERQLGRIEPPFSEAYTAPPARLGDGSYAVALYDHGATTTLLHLGPDGVVLGEQELPDTQGYDVGMKLFLGPVVALDGQDHLISWVYRQVREYRTELRRPGLTAAVWASPEWLVAATPRVVAGVTAPDLRALREDPHAPDGTRFVAREAASGRELWSCQAAFRTAAGHLLGPAAALGQPGQEGLLLVVDRGARCAEGRARALEVEERLLQAPELDASSPELVVAPPAAPARLLALDLASGETAWEVPVPDEVVGVVTSLTGVTVLARTRAGQRLVHLDLQGREQASQPIAGPPLPDAWTPALEQRRPALIARDLEAVLWATQETLTCQDLQGAVRWTLPLPGPCEGFRARTQDRFLPLVAAVVGGGRIALRDEDAVWCYG